MLFDEVIAPVSSGGDVVVPHSWCQGRTVYGGLSGGLLCESGMQGIGQDRRLRYFKVSFLKPLEPDKPFRLELKDVSAGRTLTVRHGRIIQDGVTRATAQANFVAKLASQVEIETFTPPDMPSWDADGTTKIRAPDLPSFTQYFDFRVATGGFPYRGEGAPELGGWMRFEQHPESISESHLVCLIDVWPPVPVSYYERVVPLSTINWEVHFGNPVDGTCGHEFLGYFARTNFFSDGYGSSTADVWAPDGRFLARSQQTFVIYG